MKRFALTAAAVLACAFVFAQTVAVLGFESDDFCLDSRTGTMSDLLTDELVGIDSVSVLERKQVNRILEEMHFQAAGYTDAETAKTIGKMLNATALSRAARPCSAESLWQRRAQSMWRLQKSSALPRCPFHHGANSAAGCRISHRTA